MAFYASSLWNYVFSKWLSLISQDWIFIKNFFSNYHLQRFFSAFRLLKLFALSPKTLCPYIIGNNVHPLLLLIHMRKQAQLLSVTLSALWKKAPEITRSVSSSSEVACKCCSFKCLFEGKNCILSLCEQYHTVRFTSKQLNAFPSIVFKVFHSLYFPSSVNKATSFTSKCLKLGF